VQQIKEKDLKSKLATRLKAYAYPPVRRIIRGVFRIAGKHSKSSPADVVKANTKEAFDFFYSQDDFIAQHYLEPDRWAFYELAAEYCASMLMSCNVAGAVRVIDIGCGMGHMLETLRQRLAPKYDVELFGLDFSSTGIQKAKMLLPTAKFLMEDIYENSLPSDLFDLVLCTELLEHVRWPERAFRELLRVCKTGGSIVVTVPNGEKDTWDGHVNFWNPSQFRELLASYGAVDIKLLQDDTVIIAGLIKQTTGTK
jgi:2-polyprenyl-3-methyl-5-hydroxy-6-metoxy-1,4-benzoquinol methylase